MTRLLVLLFVLCASTANATPGCEEDALNQARTPFELPADLEEIPEEEVVAPRKELASSPRPRLRPCRFRKFEVEIERMNDRGAICGDWTIIGETRKPFKGRYRGCGIVEPVRIRAVSGILLSQFATLDCPTAITLKAWLENTAKPAFADQGGGLKGLRLAGHYACKTQNNQPRARLSAHAQGRAIDISSFILMDGTIITVQDGWADEDTKDVMQELHAGACGVFGTVLGPDADRFHAGHFHFDTTRRRNGSYCR